MLPIGSGLPDKRGREGGRPVGLANAPAYLPATPFSFFFLSKPQKATAVAAPIKLGQPRNRERREEGRAWADFLFKAREATFFFFRRVSGEGGGRGGGVDGKKMKNEWGGDRQVQSNF